MSTRAINQYSVIAHASELCTLRQLYIMVVSRICIRVRDMASRNHKHSVVRLEKKMEVISMLNDGKSQRSNDRVVPCIVSSYKYNLSFAVTRQ